MSVSALRAPAHNPDLCKPGVEWRVDDALHRIFVTMRGQVKSRPACLELCSIFLNRPDAVTYDMLYDMRDYQGDVSPADVEKLVAVYTECKPDSSVPCRTSFATPDPNFQLWAAAFNAQFAGRSHKAFKLIDDAVVWLELPLVQR